MNIVHCEQGKEEWLSVRTGRVCASEVAEATSFLKINRSPKKAGDSSDTRDKYILALVGEVLSGRAAENFVSKYMEAGTMLEPMARQEYAMREGVVVKQVGFIIHPTILRSGASPDGLVYRDGKLLRGLELKCPKIETHLQYMVDRVLPKAYEPQVMWNLACAPEVPEWDFVSFCPELEEDLQQFKITVARDEDRIAELEAAVRRTLADADAVLASIRQGRTPLKEQLRMSVAEPFVSSGDHEEDMRRVADSLFGDERVLQA